MICTDYPIDALDILLDEGCVSERYFPLIGRKAPLIAALKALGCVRKSDVEKISDRELTALGLEDDGTVALFRHFLTIYDRRSAKFRELDKLSLDPVRRAVYEELYYLPGVKATRAELYFLAGLTSAEAFAQTTAEAVIEGTTRAIAENQLSCIVPLPKEVRTHIAVAKAFTAK